MIKIVNYGLGNLSAFLNVYKRLNKPAELASTADELTGADKVILPGVGAFDNAMALLERSGMRDRLDQMVLTDKIPVLGVCVGMQILCGGSDEGKSAGLGWIKGHVRHFDPSGATDLLVPHMGWNDVRPTAQTTLLDNLDDARFYFLHSYYFDCADPGHSIAVSNYGSEFTCAVGSGNVFGVQFHPEKSHHFGTQLLKNFAEI